MGPPNDGISSNATNLINCFENLVLNFQIFNDGFNHQIGFFDHTIHVGRTVQSLQYVGDKFILLFAIVFELLFCNTTQTGFDAVLCLFN